MLKIEIKIQIFQNGREQKKKQAPFDWKSNLVHIGL